MILDQNPPAPPSSPPVPAASPALAAALPADLRAEARLTAHRDVETLARAYVDKCREYDGVKDLIGKRAETLSPEDAQRFFAALGRPETPDAYDFARPDLPDGMAWDDELEVAFREAAHAAGLLPKQAAATVDAFASLMTRRHADATAAERKTTADSVAALRREWGLRYDRNLLLAKKGLESIGDPGFNQLLRQSGLGAHPALVKALARIGAVFAEDSLEGGAPGGDFAGGPDDARRRIGERHRDAAFMKAYMTADHPHHDDAVAEMRRLHEAATA